MARWTPARADVVGEYAGEVLAVFPRGRILVGLGGIEDASRRAFAADLAAAITARGTPAAATAFDGGPDGVDGFRDAVVAPFRRGATLPGDRAALVVSGPFLQHPELAGLWHANAWLQVPRALARRREAVRRGVPEDDPALTAEFSGIDRFFREVDARKRATATFDLTDPERPRRVFEDAC